MEENKVHIVNVSTFPPRRCGIGSFAKDMLENLGNDNWMTCPIVWEPGKTSYHPDHINHILTEIDQNKDDSYDKGAYAVVERIQYLRKHGRDGGCYINHENGIFADQHTRDNAVRFVEILSDAGIATAIVGHTVLYDSNHLDFEQKREVLGGMMKKASKFICLTPSVIHTLTDESKYGERFGFGRGKLIYIAHGIPDIHIPEKREELKKEYDFVNEQGKSKILYTSVGYLSRGKGLEYLIEGYSMVLDRREDRDRIAVLIAGSTHPDVLRDEGEAYREELVELAKSKKNINGVIVTRDNEGKSNITDLYGVKVGDLKGANLVFLNTHVPDSELLRIMKMSDCGIVVNTGRNQISSGPGAYWIGSSRITIATESPFFKDMEDQGIGLLVPFDDPEAIADRMNHVADISMSFDGKDEVEFIASDFGVVNPWSNVGPRYYNLMRKLVQHKAGLRNGAE